MLSTSVGLFRQQGRGRETLSVPARSLAGSGRDDRPAGQPAFPRLTWTADGSVGALPLLPTEPRYAGTSAGACPAPQGPSRPAPLPPCRGEAAPPPHAAGPAVGAPGPLFGAPGAENQPAVGSGGGLAPLPAGPGPSAGSEGGSPGASRPSRLRRARRARWREGGGGGSGEEGSRRSGAAPRRGTRAPRGLRGSHRWRPPAGWGVAGAAGCPAGPP